MPYSDPEAAKAAQARYRARQRAQRPAAVKRANVIRQRRHADKTLTLSREIAPDLKNQGHPFLIQDGLDALALWAAGNDARQAAIIRALEVRPRVKSQAGLKRWLTTAARRIVIDAHREIRAALEAGQIYEPEPIHLPLVIRSVKAHSVNDAPSAHKPFELSATPASRFLSRDGDDEIRAALRAHPGVVEREVGWNLFWAPGGLTIRHGVRLPPKK